ncbi:MAG: hypothetical protein ACOH2J_11760 [Allorhizobium sp.]
MAGFRQGIAWLLASALVLGACPAAWAENSAIRLFGREIVVADGEDGQVLTIDGEQVLTNVYISVDEGIVIDGVPVLVGTSSPGGNACEGSPFVITLKKGEAPVLSGPIESCAGMEMTEEADQLAFASQAYPGRDSERWTWSPSSGFEEQQSVAFEPDGEKGWAEFGSDRLSHPAELMNYAEIAIQIDQMLGDDKDLLETLLTGPGSGAYKGSLYVGNACMAHNCDQAQALILADAQQREVYLAWKPEGEKIVVRPPVSDWPARAKVELRAWAVKWK